MINSQLLYDGQLGDPVRVIEYLHDCDRRNSTVNGCNVQFVQSKAIGWVRSDFIEFADGGEYSVT